MKEKNVYGVVLALLLMGTLVIIFKAHQTTGKTWYVGPPPADFTSIQEAINHENVSDGDVIEVMWKDTPYYESVIVNKSLIIRRYSFDPPGYYPIVDGINKQRPVFNVTSLNVEINGFTIRNGYYGVYLHSDTAKIINNTVTSNTNGIFLEQSFNCTLRNNKLNANNRNFGVSGYTLQHYIHDIDDSNKVEGKPVRYWTNRSYGSILDAGYVAVVNSTNVVVENGSLRKNVQGALVVGSSNITLRGLELIDNSVGVLVKSTAGSKIGNILVSGDEGIVLENSSNNSICSNIILHNGYDGIKLCCSQNNTISDNLIKSTYIRYGCGVFLLNSDNNIIAGNDILDNLYSVVLECNGSIFYHNNFINNQERVMCTPVPCINSWNLTREGNYWDNETETGWIGQRVDNDGDGINDPPCKYRINDNNIDYHPLNETWSSVREINATLWHILSEPGDKQYNITLYSDNVIASRKFTPNWTQGYGLITFNITASTAGICSVDVPRARLDSPIELKINGTLVEPNNYDLTVINGTHLSLRFNYTEGRHMIEIKGYRLGFAIGDINGDGKVSMDDVMIVIDAFGKKYP
jgi:parallel beta-helix repeat protein